MELLWFLVAILAIILATYYRRRESMTNADVQSAMQDYGDTSGKHQKHTSGEVGEFPIYGPKIKHPPVKPSGDDDGNSKNKKRNTGIYPDIYGPDVPMTPGKRPHDGKHHSDDTSDDTYQFNPDYQKAFPTDGPPQPYLTNFSKFQH